MNEVKIENLIDAYFAKKEYTVQTENQAGTHEYKFGGKKAKNQTGDAGQKSSVADAILKNVTETLKKEKKYAKKEKVVEALIANEYGTDATDKTVTFPVFELGADFKKVSSAPLEDKLYLVAKTMLLDGKQATITIKEKDGIIKGSADAVLPVLEITEAQMEQTTPTTGAVQGSQKTEFTGTVKDNMVKIPIHLRPESDDELKQWKEKLGKGKEDGTYTYKFYQETSIPNGSGERKRIAGIILDNAKNGRFNNPKIEEGKTAYQDDIENALTETLYLANKTISFKLYKKEKELLYLNVKAQGEKQHDKNFLKQEGAYFEVGGKCICEARIRAYMRMLRVGEGTGEIIKSYDSKEKKVIYIPHSFDKGYTMLFGGGDFTKAPHNKDMSTHPNIKVYWYTNKNGDKVHSSASGAYQVMGYTWSDNGMIEKRNTYNIQDFSFENQDKFCIVLFKCKREGMLDLIIKGDIKGATETYGSYEWASLPPGRYGQPNETMEKALEFYEKFYEEELVGKSPLHIKSGFLKEFNIVCQCGSGATLSKNSKWHHPVDNPQLRGVYAVWAPERSIHSSNIPGRSKGKHDGIDLYAPQPTQIYACVDGEVNEIYVSETYGNCINIKGEYNGKTYWFFYAHLSSVSIYAKDGSGNPTKVKAGDPIGLSGKTGSSATALKANQVHLHFEVRTTANRTGGRVDPFVHISELNNEVIKNPQEKDQP